MLGKRTQQTDSTYILARMRQMNRLEVVGEAMRLVLDDLAVVAPKVYERIKKRSGYHAMGVRLTCIVFPRAKPSR